MHKQIISDSIALLNGRKQEFNDFCNCLKLANLLKTVRYTCRIDSCNYCDEVRLRQEVWKSVRNRLINNCLFA